MSTSYNKETEGSRIGNWVEEGALKAMTGTSRYDVRAVCAMCCAASAHSGVVIACGCLPLRSALVGAMLTLVRD